MTHTTQSETLNTSKPTRPWFLVQEPTIRKALVLGIATILVWRGVWLLLDLFFIPSNLPLSAVLSIVMGLLAFMVFGEVRL